MQKFRDKTKVRPVAWFFAISLGIELVVVAVFLLSGAAEELEAAIRTTGLGERTDFISAGRLVALEPQSWLGVFLSILQPLSPDIAAFVVAAVAFGLTGVVFLVRRYRFWSRDVGWRRGMRVWGLMLFTFLAMSLGTAGLNYLFAPTGSFEWVNTPILSWTFPLALLASIFLDIGGDRGNRLAWVRVAAPAGQDDAPRGDHYRRHDVGRVALSREARHPRRRLWSLGRSAAARHPRRPFHNPLHRDDLLLQ